MATKASSSKTDLLRLYLAETTNIQETRLDALLKPRPALTLSMIAKATVIELIDRGYSFGSISVWRHVTEDIALTVTRKLIEAAFLPDSRKNSQIKERIIDPLKDEFAQRCVHALRKKWEPVIDFYRSKLPNTHEVNYLYMSVFNVSEIDAPLYISTLPQLAKPLLENVKIDFQETQERRNGFVAIFKLEGHIDDYTKRRVSDMAQNIRIYGNERVVVTIQDS
jgi:hypothetical protein